MILPPSATSMFPFRRTVTYCQPGESNAPQVANPSVSTMTQQHTPPQQPQFHMNNSEIQRIRQQQQSEDDHEHCAGCLWTGVLTCAGLSVYFTHVAYEDWMEAVAKSPQKTRIPPPRNSYLWGGIAVGWMVAGIYRFQMG
mmetsp:Transcript_14826/g.30565  ORF Transcript_14826/g.30565 Transcript_14826/m.30565 type:complete len:140 (-) Transcript_14826:847-1266(-)